MKRGVEMDKERERKLLCVKMLSVYKYIFEKIFLFLFSVFFLGFFSWMAMAMGQVKLGSTLLFIIIYLFYDEGRTAVSSQSN